NRGASSASGSADVLEAAGANVELEPDQVGRCIREVGVGFLFAVRHHAAMRHAGPVRRELGIGTVFNLLGPLTNPAGARRQVLGVFAPAWQRPVAEVAQALGSERVLVVHSDGLDELSIQGPSVVVELDGGSIDSYEVSPTDFGLREKTMDDLRAATPEQSFDLIRSALNESNDAASDVVALNAGAAIYASGVATTLANGVVLAQDLIASGQASEKLKEFVDLTRMMGEI
ncbi:MAG: anthranilate phosphoribosyltransferase, partial [Gammaproteobacteria bacterium]|nr:anthranilate phosphoribosyltransferase [Gammaproteobacteria bacterium]